MLVEPISLNLSEILPNVLFLGNGISYNEEYSWNRVIEKVSKNEKTFPALQNNYGVFQVPNTLLTFALCDTDDDKRRNSYMDALKGYNYPENKHLKELIEIPFDAILTTNYTYDIENAADPLYPKSSDVSKRNNSFCNRKDSKYLIHTYNKIGSSPPIWHIHGEHRRKTSIILTHDEYARLIGEIIKYNTSRKNDYQKYYTNLKMKSWIDFFIMGNIYFLGYSLDFSEFDIWWLLSRRLREKAKVGRVYFYEPSSEQSKYKHKVLELCGFEVNTLGYTFNDTNHPYEEFYSEAVIDIKNKITM